MLFVYNSIPKVGEIVLIDNATENKPDLSNFDKLRVITKGENLFVNPSWKFGVQESKFNNIVLVNDDITIGDNITYLFELVSNLLRENVVIGPSEKCYIKEESSTAIKFIKVTKKHKMNYGFGVFMFMKKSTFINTPIPNELLVWRGDRILHLRNKVLCFEGINIVTRMRGTTSKINLTGFAEREKLVFNKYLKTI
jgi:hypothetical protein